MIVYTARNPGESEEAWERRLEDHRRQVKENEAKLLAARARFQEQKKRRPQA